MHLTIALLSSSKPSSSVKYGVYRILSKNCTEDKHTDRQEREMKM